MSDPFFKLFVTVNLANQKILHWKMNGSFKPTAPVSFYIDKARSAGTWEQMAGPIIDNCMYVDNSKWNWNKDKNTFYRIRFKRDGRWVYSVPAQAVGEWDDKDYAIAHEICRKEAVINRLAGQSGVFMKRRAWGALCTQCTDFDTREVVDISCPLCFGTGILGGYWSPIPMFLWNTTPPSNKRTVGQERGTAHVIINKNRCIAYPFVEKNDLWFNDKDNTRWCINDVEIVSERKGIPILLDITMSQAPRSDVMYGTEMNTKIALPAAELPAGTGNEYGWNKGVSCEEDKY